MTARNAADEASARIALPADVEVPFNATSVGAPCGGDGDAGASLTAAKMPADQGKKQATARPEEPALAAQLAHGSAGGTGAIGFSTENHVSKDAETSCLQHDDGRAVTAPFAAALCATCRSRRGNPGCFGTCCAA